MASASRRSFAELLQHILVHEQKRKLKDVAEAVGLNTRNFYGRVTGRIQFTPDEINRVIRVVPDPRLGDWLLANTELTCNRRIAPAPNDPRSTAVDLALHGVEEGMAALRSVLALGAAEEMSPDSLAVVEAHIVEAQRQLGALQMTLRSRARTRADGNGAMPVSAMAMLASVPVPRGRG
jgi:hypothetical protein